MKWLKRISGIFTVLSCGLIVFFRSPFGAESIGIISSADGPTVICHATTVVSYYKIALFAAPIFFVIWLALHIKSKKLMVLKIPMIMPKVQSKRVSIRNKK